MQTNLRRGQAGVEYLFVLVFLVGFVVAVIVPAVKEAELSVAIASVRSAAISFETKNPDFSVKEIGYTINESTVVLDPKTFHANGTRAQTPPALLAAMRASLKESVASKSNETCATAANYQYCFPSR